MSIVKNTFRKLFPEPSEDKLFEKAFLLLESLKKMESKQKTYKQYQKLYENIQHSEHLIEIAKTVPVGKRKPVLNMVIAFIRLHKSMNIRCN